jgi:CheY-like chemotaxis protein
VLLVDDNRVFRDELADVLKAEGLVVAVAEDSRAALGMLETTDLPSVVLLDWMMPGMSGEEFLGALESDARLSSLRVVIMSAHPHAGLGYSRPFVPKPINLDFLLLILRGSMR